MGKEVAKITCVWVVLMYGSHMVFKINLGIKFYRTAVTTKCDATMMDLNMCLQTLSLC